MFALQLHFLRLNVFSVFVSHLLELIEVALAFKLVDALLPLLLQLVLHALDVANFDSAKFQFVSVELRKQPLFNHPLLQV